MYKLGFNKSYHLFWDTQSEFVIMIFRINTVGSGFGPTYAQLNRTADTQILREKIICNPSK